MIKKMLNIFVPQTFKGNTLLPLKTIAITFEPGSVIATATIQKGASFTVAQTATVSLASDKQSDIVQAIKDVIKQIGSYDKLVATLSSSFVTFKELSFPFLDEEKIRMVLPFEIEALLPFDTSQACIDFIVTKQDTKEKQSDIMVAAVQKKYIQELSHLFEQADLELSSITTDVMSLYGLYKRRTADQQGNSAFIELGTTESKVAFFVDGQLKYIRTVQEPFEKGKPNESFWKKTMFTLQSFKADTARGDSLKKILLFGDMWKDIIMTAEEKFDAPCQYFDMKRFATEASLTFSKNVMMPSVSLLGLAAALPLPKGQIFSLREPTLNRQESTLFAQQIIVGAVLIVGLLGLAGGSTFYTIRTLSLEKERSEKEILQTLKKQFPSLKKNASLSSALDEAHRTVRKEENIWSSLSQQTRQSFLRYLSVLSTNIEREVLGLNLKKLVITKNTITLEGNVRNFEAIDQFEQQLKATKLFVNSPDLQSVDFSTPLTLQDQGGA